jgi:PST family polysaccharide transporter
LKAIQKILGKNIWLKISAFNSVSVFVRVLTGWIINKLIAFYIGPEGTSVSEQFRNFFQTIQGFSSLGISDGVTKYAAKYQDNKKQLSSFLSSAYKIVLITSIIVGLMIIIFAKQINIFLFDQRDFSFLIIVLGIMIPFFAFQIILTAVLNGFQKYKKLTYINIISNVLSAIIAAYLIIFHSIYGALVLILATQVVSFVLTLFYIRKDMGEVLQFSNKKTDKKHYKRLQAYMLMALVSAIVIPLFSILLRNQVNDFFAGDNGVHSGYWDGIKKISGLFLMLIMPVFSMYYYPQLTKIHSNKAYFVEVKKFFKQIFPLFTIGMIILYLLRHWAVLLFYSDAYEPMEELFVWQLLGDYVRVISLILAFLMLAKTKVIHYIYTEIGFWVLYYILTPFFMAKYQLEGISIAYFVSYLVYLLSLLFIFRKLFTKKEVLI